jgi:single-stranded-DNA-specific exonuclease
MTIWKLKSEDNPGTANYGTTNSIISKILLERGISSAEEADRFLRPDYERDLHDPFLFSDMEKAVKRIVSARQNREIVAVFGDYDADGVTSTVLLAETLKKIGLQTLVYIPDRKREGYGLNEKALQQLKGKGAGLIITVDCGISNLKEIEKARDEGLDIIVIDHHYVPEEIPPAFAIINPRTGGSKYPFHDLAGVGVTFKAVQAIYDTFFKNEKDQLKWLLDIVALGTVADCVTLLGENRVLVKFGLLVLSKTRRTGLREIFSVAGMRIDENNLPGTREIAFQLAPRINAAGRMDHANAAYNLLYENDRIKARALALELESNNANRQKETNRVVEEVRIIAANAFRGKKFVFAVSEHYPIGTAGLVAGKIAEEFNKPAIILQKEKEISRGSIRGIPAFNVIESLNRCRNLLLRCGGHRQAAGVTVSNDKLDDFYRRFSEIAESELRGVDCSPRVEIDAEIKSKDIDFELAQFLEELKPFGEGNPEPLFLMCDMKVEEIKNVGANGQHLKIFLSAPDETPKIFEAIGFNFNGQFSSLKKGDAIDAVFNVREDNWNGSKKIQLRLADLKIKR